MLNNPVHVIGGGLAGSEAAWQLVNGNIPVIIHEMRPIKNTQAHQTDRFAELVCSNSFRSDEAEKSAIGLLHEEMRRASSLILKSADLNRVPAGGALAVDRDHFSQRVQNSLENHPLVTIIREELTSLPPKSWGLTIVATGPLTSEPLAQSIQKTAEVNSLSFFDAIAPIVNRESINMKKAWFQSRYDKGEGSDYINCPLSVEQYEKFIEELLEADIVDFKTWEQDTPYFEGCLPIEVMAFRGPQTLRYGPMKPVGLTNPHNPNVKPYAVVQLRQDNKLATLFNLVGFQTKLKHKEQIRIFRSIPGLENATFERLGGLHRNTFINSPRLLDETLRLKNCMQIRFAGQITGCEGYVESAAIGLLAGRFAASEMKGQKIVLPPKSTAMGSLLFHITSGAFEQTFQPMNINFGLFPPLPQKVTKKERKPAQTKRALADINEWVNTTSKLT
tara:strand:+ start:37 stop:1377 length:1341 start_codon:yes stop_codon:yes gene_type:complete